MPKRIAPLTVPKIDKTKSEGKAKTLFDGEGLYLLITPSGGKLWNLKYRYEGIPKRLSLGAYPAVSLVDARKRREDAKKLLANGVDPGAVKKAQKAARSEVDANSFEIVAREWFNRFKGNWTEGTSKRKIERLERDVFPWLGHRPIIELKPLDLLQVLRRIEDRGALDVAHRAKYCCGQIFRYAVQTGRAERDISADLKGALPPQKVKHHAALTDVKDVTRLLRDIDSFQGSFPVMCALRLAPILFVRPGELRQAEWSEFSMNDAVWNIPAEKMKMKQAHLVPLSCQAVAILKELQPLTGNGKYVFPSIRTNTRTMSENTVNAALRRLGYSTDEMTGHGFRATARTILHEILGFTPDAIEAQLAHAVPDRLGRAYNRTQHLAERRKMMQHWADYLDGLKKGCKVIPFLREAA